MVQLIWIIAILLISFATYLISYFRFRSVIATQTRQMIQLMKAEEADFAEINNVFDRPDEDFADLERAAMGLRKKYLRLKRQSAEERTGYETVFSGLKEAIVTVDQNLKIISFNASFLSYFKWVPLKNQANYFLHDVVRDPSIIATFKKTFQNNSSQKNESEELQLFVTPLPSRLENQTWCLGVFYDLSEIRRTEKMKVDFVANASHELRTPLTVIKGYSDLLLKKINGPQPNPELIELVKPIVASSESMSELVEDLLSLSKLDQSSNLQKEFLTTSEVTNEVVLEIENMQQLRNKKIEIHCDCQSVFGNYDAVKQILRNLVFNAIKYSGTAEKIQIHWEKNSKWTILKVKDFGLGISKEHQERIFERFYRIDKGRGRDQGGSGLGLALVKHHMLNHKGKISVNSNTGQGTEFICEFPNEFPMDSVQPYVAMTGSNE